MMMAETKDPNDLPADETTPRNGNRALIVAFVSVVIVLETAMFFFLVPSAEEVSALAEAQLIRSVQQGELAAEERASTENSVKEFKLGLFGETFSPIDTERFYRVEIDLYGLVRRKNLEKMEAEFEEKEGRLRHEIRKKIRNSELKELNENNLGLLERRILTTCNHLLNEDLLLGIGFRSYQLIEQ
jgi:hypothetical protein